LTIILSTFYETANRQKRKVYMTQRQHTERAKYYLDPMNGNGGVTSHNVAAAEAHALVALAIRKHGGRGSIRQAQYYLDPMNGNGGASDRNIAVARAHALAALSGS
jgi:hypothetical protein